MIRTSYSTLTTVSVLAAAALTAGCAAGDVASEAGVRVDTIGGVVRVTSGERGVWGPGEGWRVDIERALTIGEVDGEDAYVFGRIAGVYVADDGRIYVGDWQATEVRIFGPDGRFLGRFGRDGEGPGEFRHIGGVGGGPGGGVAVLDGELGRVSVFDDAGGFRRMFRLERP